MDMTAEIKVKPRSWQYSSGLRWTGEKKGILAVLGKPPLEVASPPEFKGHPGIWSPEDLLVSSVNACVMMTFLTFAARKEIGLVSYESEATGTLELLEGKSRFTRILVRPRIVVEKSADRDRALAVLQEAERACLISNSLNAKVGSDPEITVRA